jgi:hypothetical protein
VAGAVIGAADLSVSGSALVVCGEDAAFDGGKYVVVAPLGDVSEPISAAKDNPLPAEQNAKTPRLSRRRAESLFIPKWLR